MCLSPGQWNIQLVTSLCAYSRLCHDITIHLYYVRSQSDTIILSFVLSQSVFGHSAREFHPRPRNVARCSACVFPRGNSKGSSRWRNGDGGGLLAYSFMGVVDHQFLHSVPSEYPLVTAPLLTKHVISLVYDVWVYPLLPLILVYTCYLLFVLVSLFTPPCLPLCPFCLAIFIDLPDDKVVRHFSHLSFLLSFVLLG